MCYFEQFSIVFSFPAVSAQPLVSVSQPSAKPKQIPHVVS